MRKGGGDQLPPHCFFLLVRPTTAFQYDFMSFICHVSNAFTSSHVSFLPPFLSPLLIIFVCVLAFCLLPCAVVCLGPCSLCGCRVISRSGCYWVFQVFQCMRLFLTCASPRERETEREGGGGNWCYSTSITDVTSTSEQDWPYCAAVL